ncbi:hypothetical protein SAMN05216358_4213 [Rhizobium sp. AN5]|uniref:hypothetical protein n=1 Tax=Rhizobium sp. AN5 TaxID=1855304 RepID=UPI000BDB3F69|nr:hypothetical protein [Rhizobium sp. AN5]SOC94013.1 hypothetical protein SAMN05216358_4213 [Rhizobium sp. AN5]
MNGYYPPAPSAQQQPQRFDPFALYAKLAQPSPEQKRQQMAQSFAQQMIGQPAQNTAQGLGQLAAGIGLGLSKYAQAGSQFPAAPGGAQPGLASALSNFFTNRNSGGLY